MQADENTLALERRTMRTVYWRLLPFLLLLYIISWLDRVNVSFAKLQMGPDLGIGDAAFFGPVVTPAPKGEAAGLLWDGVLLVARTDGFFELKRSRTRPAITS